MKKEKSKTNLNKKPSPNKNPFTFGEYPNIKKPKTDYGKITVNALKRATAEEFYTAEELAERIRVNIMTIYRYIKAGRLTAYKIGKEFRIEKNEFNKFLNKVKTK